MGRETLQRTVDLAQTQLNMEVVYGDPNPKPNPNPNPNPNPR